MICLQETEEEFVKFEKKLGLLSELGQSLVGGEGEGSVEERAESLQDRLGQ